MTAFDQKLSRIRAYVLGGSIVGLALTIIVAIVRNDEVSSFNDVEFVALFCGPFLVALLSLLVARVEYQRWIWAVCAIWAAVTALPLIFSGVGFFLLAIASLLGWAAVASGNRQLPLRH